MKLFLLGHNSKIASAAVADFFRALRPPRSAPRRAYGHASGASLVRPRSRKKSTILATNLFLSCALATLFVVPALAVENTAASAFRSSYALENQKNYEGAIRALSGLYNVKPRDFFLNLRLGWLNYMNGNYKNALTHYDNAITQNGKAVNAFYGKMNTLLAQGNWKEAEAVSLQLTRQMPSDYVANLRLANIYISEKKYIEAQDVVSRLAVLYPESAELLNTAGYIHRLKGEKNEADGIFQKVLIVYPDNAIAKNHLAEMAKESSK